MKDSQQTVKQEEQKKETQEVSAPKEPESFLDQLLLNNKAASDVQSTLTNKDENNEP